MDTPPPFISSIPRFVQLFFARPLWYGIDPYLWQLWMNSHGSDRDRPRKRMFQSKMWKIWKLCSSQLSLVATWADLLSYLMASICFYWTDCAFCGKNFGSGNSHGDFHHGVLLQPGFEKIVKKDLGFLSLVRKELGEKKSGCGCVPICVNDVGWDGTTISYSTSDVFHSQLQSWTLYSLFAIPRQFVFAPQTKRQSDGVLVVVVASKAVETWIDTYAVAYQW